jgi:hypothetical protein
VAFGWEAGDVTGEPDDDGGADRTDPDDVINEFVCDEDPCRVTSPSTMIRLSS